MGKRHFALIKIIGILKKDEHNEQKWFCSQFDKKWWDHIWKKKFT